MKRPAFLLLLACALLPARAQPPGPPGDAATQATPEDAPAQGQAPAPAAPGSTAPDALAKTLAARSAEEALAVVQPVLIGKRYLDQAGKSLAVQLARMGAGTADPQTWLEDNALVAREFVADVRIIYVLEFPEGTQLVSQGMMRSWGMDLERLHQRALANLDRLHGTIAVKPVGKLPWLNVIDAQDGFAASRVLLHWRWAQLTLTLGEALILGMPTRDVVVFTASLERKKLEQLRDTVETVERHQGRPVSRRLFAWTPQGWQEFDESSLPLDEPQEQPGEQGGEKTQEHGGAEGKMVAPPAQAAIDVAGQAAQAESRAHAGEQRAGDEDRHQQDQQPLQHQE